MILNRIFRFAITASLMGLTFSLSADERDKVERYQNRHEERHELKPGVERRVRLQERLGKVDAIYPEQSRVIINDMSYFYSPATVIQTQYGSTVLKIEDVLKKGMPVKMYVNQKGDNLILKGLKIISQDELKASRKLRLER